MTSCTPAEEHFGSLEDRQCQMAVDGKEKVNMIVVDEVVAHTVQEGGMDAGCHDMGVVALI